MDAEASRIAHDINQLVDEYRTRCLWFLRSDYYPETPEQQLRILSTIERTGDLAAFRRVSTLRQWVSRHSSARSAS